MRIDDRTTLQKLEVLCLVVELGGIGRAAERLFVSQPVISAHVRSLEGRLGVKLFYRDGRQIRLTEAGVSVHEWAKEVLARTRDLDRYLNGLSDGKRGAVHLAASMSLGSYHLSELLAQFYKEHLLVKISLAVTDTEHAVEGLRNGDYDFVVVVPTLAPDFCGLDVRHVGTEHMDIVGAPSLVGDGQLSIEDLSAMPFVEAEGTIRRTWVDEHLRELGLPPRQVAIRMGHPEAMKRAVMQGLGLAVLFRNAVEKELASGHLCRVDVDGFGLSVPIVALSRKSKAFSPLHEELLDKIAASFGPDPSCTQHGGDVRRI